MVTRPAVIFIGGDPPHHDVVDNLPREAFVIAADSGWEHAVAAGRVPDLLVGDMDSISPRHLGDARARGTEIIEHSPHKDFTDAEIAMEVARGRGHQSLIVVSGGGTRFDHVLSLVHSMAAHAHDCDLVAFIGGTHITYVHAGDKATLDVAEGSTMSLIPLGGPAAGITTVGLKWELNDGTLESFASRGVSNVTTAVPVSISLTSGTLAVVTPHHEDCEPQ